MNDDPTTTDPGQGAQPDPRGVAALKAYQAATGKTPDAATALAIIHAAQAGVPLQFLGQQPQQGASASAQGAPFDLSKYYNQQGNAQLKNLGNAVSTLAPQGGALEGLQALVGMGASRVPILSKLMGYSGPQSYPQSLATVQQGKQSVNPALRTVLGLAGTAAQMEALPGSSALQGALLGAGNAALASDPNKSLESRAISAPFGALAGAAAGRVGDKLAGTLGGAIPTLGSLGAPSAEEAAVARPVSALGLGPKARAQAMLSAGTNMANVVMGKGMTLPGQLTDPSASVPAFMQAIQRMTPDEAQAALEGFQGRLGEILNTAGQGGGAISKLLLGAPRAAAEATGAAPVTRALGAASDAGPIISALQRQAGSTAISSRLNAFLPSLLPQSGAPLLQQAPAAAALGAMPGQPWP